jgi:LPPG:FO 2-phospho-L-lactate transferase
MPDGRSAGHERVVVLAGGVGGGRFLAGLASTLAAGELTAVVNTGDDFEHWGLSISPDLDTVMYHLAGISHDERGWGLREETWTALEMVERYGGESWFRLGDRDLATHLMRSQWLRSGMTLSQVTERLCEALGISTRLLPMCEDACRTIITSTDGTTWRFQDWLVEQKGRPRVRAVHWEGAGRASDAVIGALADAALVIIAPSNPYVSIDPILALEPVRRVLLGRRVVAVTPIVHGRAVKGPLGEMIPALAGRPASAAAICAHYGELLSGIVVERGDGEGIDIPVLATDTIMLERADRERLAREVLDFGASLE